ncbi:MAG: Peptidoglycan/LPS O-acetylase OafA/YrhL, contains acyltransferase and SGNH-hydrolase domain [Microbacteriaceae bacterium]|nr:Peptidoglycan/LPS O-acetylase OafA/YrhL, contains acyltransferase and SGNH-hydrolase domain [Microbacteriaceae bacterium]
MGQGEVGSVGRRYRSLDGLRGIAAVVVLLHHSLLLVPALAAPYYGSYPSPKGNSWAWWLVDTPLHAFWEGKAAVYIFFVLSGLVLALPVIRSPRFSWRSFYPQRMIRLYLPVWAAVVFAVLTIQLVPRSGVTGSDWLQERLTSVTPSAFVKDMTLVLGNSGLVSPLWSLRWEILFSLALPIFVWLALKWRALNWVKVVACLAIVAVGGVTENSVLLYLPMFLIGAIIASALPVLHDRVATDGPARQKFWAAMFVTAAILLVSRWLLLGVGAPMVLVNATTGLMLAGAAMMVLTAIFWVRANTFLSRRGVQWLGRISFSLYLVHEPIVVACGYVFGAGHEWIGVTAAIPIAMGVAWLFHRFVEKPSHRLAKVVQARSRASIAVAR